MGEESGLKVFALAVAFFTGAGLCGGLALAASALRLRPIDRRGRRLAALCFAILPLEGAAFLWGLVEPRWLEVTFTTVETARLPPGERLRVVHLTDLHVAGSNALLEGLADRVNALRPDLVVFTGDALNEPRARPVFERLFAGIDAPLGRFGVAGNWDAASAAKLFGGSLSELRGAPRALAEGRLTLCGAPFGSGGQLASCLRSAGQGVRIVAYHTPDLVEELAPLAPDLYLAGHTHGGQVRLPFYGAVVTLSRFGKRYEMGRYRVGETTLYVNRGIGLEGGAAPPVRFLCRPELAVIDLVGRASSGATPARTSPRAGSDRPP